MISAYEMFADENHDSIERPPERWSEEQMVFELCDEDISNLEMVLDTVKYKQAVKWFLFKRYKEYAIRKASEKK